MPRRSDTMALESPPLPQSSREPSPPPSPLSSAQSPSPSSHEAAIGDDGIGRCYWAASHPVNRDYHDTEWGMPVHGEAALFERITLEAFQSGLSWLTILNKRPAFRVAFHGFDPDAVAAFTDADVERLMADAGIVRNRGKIEAARTNARAIVALRDDGGLDTLVWSFKPATTLAPRTDSDLPTRTQESAALAAELRRRGFAFVGPTTMYALMTAIGMVDAHLLGCHRRGASGIWARAEPLVEPTAAAAGYTDHTSDRSAP